MQRFRWMGLYVVLVALALGCTIGVVAVRRTNQIATEPKESGIMITRVRP